MSVNLVDLFANTVSGVIVRQASNHLDESADSIASAVEKIFPALLNAIILKAETEAGAKDVLNFMNSHNITESVLKELPSTIGGEETERLSSQGGTILKYLFGDRLNLLVDWVASGNGLRTSSASSLLRLIAPLAMAAIAKVVGDRSLNANGLRELLESQKAFIHAVTPAAISELLGVTPTTEETKVASGTLEGNFNTPGPKEGSTMSKILPWIVLLIAALGLFYFLEKGKQPPAADMEKARMDSLENVRRLDSIRNQAKLDSMKLNMRIDSAAQPTPVDSLR